MHLPLRLIFRQSHSDFINVRTAYASKIRAQLTKNLLAKSGTERFRENIILFLGTVWHHICQRRIQICTVVLPRMSWENVAIQSKKLWQNTRLFCHSPSSDMLCFRFLRCLPQEQYQQQLLQLHQQRLYLMGMQ